MSLLDDAAAPSGGSGGSSRPSSRVHAPLSPVSPFLPPARSPPTFAVTTLLPPSSPHARRHDSPSSSTHGAGVLSAPSTPGSSRATSSEWPRHTTSTFVDAHRLSPSLRGRVAAETDYGDVEGLGLSRDGGSDDDDHLRTPMLSSMSDRDDYPPTAGALYGRRKRRKVCGQSRWVPAAGVLGLLALVVALSRSERIGQVKEYAAAIVGWSSWGGTDDDLIGRPVGEAEAEAAEAEAEAAAKAGKGSKPTSGGDGSTIYREDGTSFTYRNRYGGIWDASPSGKTARAQSFTPPLSEPWDYGRGRIFGVNLGGWLTPEPFITPSLFEPFVAAPVPAIDEWTLSENLGDQLAHVLEKHYDTFISEEDFMRIADAGLNWVRIPLPFWAVDVQEGEPFLAYTAWKYFVKAVGWARKYGLRINLDLHTVPGSQNGWNHSGKMGSTNFLNGVMGLANAQRTLNVIRLLTEFIMLPGNQEVIPMFAVVNEPVAADMGADTLRRFYMHTYEMIRNVTGYGAGNGPMITFHDGFVNPIAWHGFMDGADRIALDSHFYLAFATANQDPMDTQAMKPCQKWATKFANTMVHFGLALAGEWSLAVNDCGLFVNGIEGGSRYETAFGGQAGSDVCAEWMDTATWTEGRKQGMHKFAYSYIDTTRNWFFWTWKIGISLATGKEANPMWSYERGLREGYIPRDPRQGVGFCRAFFEEKGARPPRQSQYSGRLRPHQTGGVATPTVAAKDVEAYGDFPGPTLGDLTVANLPRLTATGRPPGFPIMDVLPAGSPTPVPSPREGVANWYTAVEGCSYPGGWEGPDAPVPKAWCADQIGR